MPSSLAACSALSALSVAAQALANVRRGPDLEGPISLYLLPVAESGERKSECDRRFADVLREWEAEEVERIKPDIEKGRADFAAWEAEREAVLLKLKAARKEGKPTNKAHAELEQLENCKPEAVRVPRVLLESETEVAVESSTRRLAIGRHPFERSRDRVWRSRHAPRHDHAEPRAVQQTMEW